MTTFAKKQHMKQTIASFQILRGGSHVLSFMCEELLVQNSCPPSILSHTPSQGDGVTSNCKFGRRNLTCMYQSSTLLFLLEVNCPQGLCFLFHNPRDKLSLAGEEHGFPELPVIACVNQPNIGVKY